MRSIHVPSRAALKPTEPRFRLFPARHRRRGNLRLVSAFFDSSAACSASPPFLTDRNAAVCRAGRTAARHSAREASPPDLGPRHRSAGFLGNLVLCAGGGERPDGGGARLDEGRAQCRVDHRPAGCQRRGGPGRRADRPLRRLLADGRRRDRRRAAAGRLGGGAIAAGLLTRSGSASAWCRPAP